MVKFLTIFVLLSAYAQAEVRLVTECRRKQIYFGENVICDFEVVASHSPIDVEVVKFPEFRGFWSDNLALRQGPIVLSWPVGPSALRKGLVGTYVITPMLGRATPKILPMKISVVGADVSGPVLMESELPELKIRPLPNLPPGIPSEDFIGAVGEFSLVVESREVHFHPDEPTAIRIQIQGEGNFAELNEIPYVLPKGIEVLSKRSYQSGGRGLSSKIFDFRILVRGTQDISIPARPIYFFNPVLSRYEPMNIPEVTLKYTSKPKGVGEEEIKPIEIKAPYRTYAQVSSLFSYPFFWIVQGLLLLTAVAIVVNEERRRWVSRIQHTRAFVLKRKLRELKKLEAAKDQSQVLRAANELLDSHLLTMANAHMSDSVALVLRKNREAWRKDWVDRFEQLYYQIQQFEYAPPDRKTPVAWSEMRKNFLEILRQNPTQ